MSVGKKRPRVIAVAGNMGAGKSSLVEWLRQQFGMTPFFEPNDENPYLPDFYADMQRWAFHSQLYFLSNKFRLHQQLERVAGVVVLFLLLCSLVLVRYNNELIHLLFCKFLFVMGIGSLSF